MSIVAISAVAGGFSGAVMVAITVSAAVRGPLRKLAKANDEFRADWYGAPARSGVDARPGVMERLRGIEKELHPNGGTLRDAIHRLEVQFAEHVATTHAQQTEPTEPTS